MIDGLLHPPAAIVRTIQQREQTGSRAWVRKRAVESEWGRCTEFVGPGVAEGRDVIPIRIPQWKTGEALRVLSNSDAPEPKAR